MEPSGSLLPSLLPAPGDWLRSSCPAASERPLFQGQVLMTQEG